MNALPETRPESDSALKSALIDKAIEQFIPASTQPCNTPAAREAMDDMKAFLSGVLVLHCAGKL